MKRTILYTVLYLSILILTIPMAVAVDDESTLVASHCSQATVCSGNRRFLFDNTPERLLSLRSCSSIEGDLRIQQSDAIDATGAPAVFVDPNVSSDDAKVLAARAGVEVVALPVETLTVEVPTYADLLGVLAERITTALSG